MVKLISEFGILDRRHFLCGLLAGSSWVLLGSGAALAEAAAKTRTGTEATPKIQFRTLSVSHLGEIRDSITKLKDNGKLSKNKTFLQYIDGFDYAIPQTIPNTRSIIIMARPLRIAAVDFHLDGMTHRVQIPTGYVNTIHTPEYFQNYVMQNVIRDKSAKIEKAKLPYKTIAVRSGLAQYGKNNICYVEGMGSNLQLRGYYTDHAFQEDHWFEPKLLPLCNGCFICRDDCLTKAIRDENFVIDVEKCITLYNELPDPIPSWIPASAHNTLIGCLRCQKRCPANKDVTDDVEMLAEINEAETRMILLNKPEKKLFESVKRKLKRVDGADDLAYLSRNLNLVLQDP